MTDLSSFGRIGVVGTGRVAQALALALHRHAERRPLIRGRATERTCHAAAATGAEPVDGLADLVTGSDTIAVAVSDDAMPAVIAQMAAVPMPHAPFVFHVSGGSGATILTPLQEAGARVAAVHPAMTFTGDPQAERLRMQGARFAITAPTDATLAQAAALVDVLGGVAVVIEEAHRPLYHAALCHAANHLVTLMAGASGALTAAGVAEPGALLAPLVRAALENSLARGFAALSGPVLRGDAGTIAGHLHGIARHDPELLPAYRAMAGATLAELERRGASEDAALHNLLAQPT